MKRIEAGWRVREGLVRGDGAYLSLSPDGDAMWVASPHESELFETWEIAMQEVCSGIGDCRPVRVMRVTRAVPSPGLGSGGKVEP
jgi:hypothetical protein